MDGMMKNWAKNDPRNALKKSKKNNNKNMCIKDRTESLHSHFIFWQVLLLCVLGSLLNIDGSPK